ncbi:MAG: hypothetical protein APF76_10095 [Desulfitibacter sp. BRH_c19]|nr:MAG: hypothetical protein APF76_10095 [Desulfitibacter sp. BRH_c19]
MRCEQIQNLLSMYIDGETTVEETVIIKEHLSECIECQKEYEDLKTVLSLFNTLEPIEPPDDLRDSIMAKVKSENPEKSVFTAKKGRWIAWGATAAVIFIIVGTVGISNLLNNTMYMKSAQDSDSVQSDVAKSDIEESGIEESDIAVSDKVESDEVGIMELEEDSDQRTTQEVELFDTATNSDEEPPVLDGGEIDNETVQPRMFIKGSEELEVEEPQNTEGQVQEELFKEFLTVSVEDLDTSIDNITKLLSSSSVINKYEHEAKIIGWKEKDENDIMEAIVEFGSLEFEDSYVTDFLEEFSRLRLEKEMLVDTLNEQTQEYDQSLNIQKELEMIEWKIDTINELEIDKVVFYEIRVIEKE